jgi:hypothetical protein
MEILLFVVAIIFLGIGIIQTIYPEKTFMFGRRWMFTEESQLSDIMIILIRIAGIIVIFMSIKMLIEVMKL